MNWRLVALLLFGVQLVIGYVLFVRSSSDSGHTMGWGSFVNDEVGMSRSSLHTLRNASLVTVEKVNCKTPSCAKRSLSAENHFARTTRQFLPLLTQHAKDNFWGCSVCITIFLGINSSADVSRRMDIFSRAVQSLVRTAVRGSTLFVVDDGSAPNHQDSIHTFLKQLPRKVHLILRSENGGISKAKNSCIKYFMENTNNLHLILADADLLFDVGWHEAYISGLSADLRLLQYNHWLHDAANGNMTLSDGTVIHILPRLGQGALLAVSREVIWTVGGFVVFPEKYGFEHLEFAWRIDKAGLVDYGCMDVAIPEIQNLHMATFTAGQGAPMISKNDAFGHANLAAMEKRQDFFVPIDV